MVTSFMVRSIGPERCRFVLTILLSDPRPVDFGYILGRDPKPFPPAIKVCKEMVDLMGGTTSPHYLRFKSLCFTGFSSLRKSSNLIVNLVALMVEAGIQDFMFEPDKVVDKVGSFISLFQPLYKL